MRFTSFILSILIFTSSLFGEDPDITSFASTEGLLNSLVAGHVCPITGEFVYSQVDIVVPGPSPLTVQRTYRSRNTSQNWIHKSWQLSEPTSMHTGLDLEKNDNFAIASNAMGTELFFRKYKGKDKNQLPHALRIPDGCTNCGTNFLSGQTNLKNNKLTIFTNDPDCKYRGELTSGDGTKRIYKQVYKADDARLFQLFEEKRLNKTQTNYAYSEYLPEKISIINQSNTITYSSIDLKLGGYQSHVITSNNGKKVKYNYTGHEYKNLNNYKNTDYFLTSVESDQQPPEYYEYKSGVRPRHFWMLTKIKKPNSRYIEIEYYRDGTNVIGDCTEKIELNNRAQDRVMILKGPIGHDETPVISHRFFYHFNRDNDNNITSGRTKVLDALNHRTDYHFKKDNRLYATGEYLDNEVYRYERYFWGQDSLQGNLIAKYIEIPNSSTVSGSTFKYDEKGNVLERKEYTRINGKKFPKIDLGPDHLPKDNGAECYIYSFKYNDNNQIRTAKEPNGKKTYFTYVENTSAIASKIVRDESTIYAREFLEYDTNLFLIKKTIDDGQSMDKGNLTGVTFTKITRYKPRKTFPFGLNQEVSEYYLDQTTGKECLLSRVVNQHNQDGLLTQQDVYDSHDVFQYTIKREWDKYGNKIKEIDPIGQIVVWEYDDNNNLISTQGPNWDYKTEHRYDFSNRLIKTVEVHPDGVFTTSFTHDLVGNLIKSTDSFGNETRYKYDDLNRLIKVSYPISENSSAKPVEKYSYDIHNFVSEITDCNGNVTKKECNSRGDPLFMQYPDGTQETNFYESNGSLIKSIFKNGSFSTFTRDALGRVLSETLYGSNGDLLSQKFYKYSGFNLLEEIDPEGIKTSYEYDGAGRLISKIIGNKKTTFAYDSLNRISKEINWITPETAAVNTFEYDKLSRIISDGIQDLNGNVFSLKSYTYNSFNQRTSTTSGSSTEQTIYDTHQQPLKKIDAAGTETTFVYDYNFLNSARQNVLKITSIDSLGNQTIQIKDVQGRISIEQKLNSIGMLLAQHQNYYDLKGNLISVIHENIVDNTIIEQQVTNWLYNTNNQVVQIIEAVGTALQRVRSYSYNSLGQKQSMTKPDGIVINYTYDSKGRLSTLISSDNTVSYAYTYNKNDQIISVSDAVNKTVTKREYDEDGLLFNETLANGLSLGFEHDNLDRKTKIILPDQSTIDYCYNEIDLTKVIRKDKIHHYFNRDIFGNVLESKLAGQAGTQTFVYDQLQREISNSHPKRSQTLKKFDSVGNLLAYDQTDPLGNLKNSFSYNDLYQLIREKTSESHKYSYDSVDNRRKIDSAICLVNGLNQLTNFNNMDYKYDLNGNLISKGHLIFVYDALNRLIHSKTPLITTNYTYDSFNRRISKGDETYLYDGQNEIGVFKQNTMQSLRVLGESLEAEIGGTVLIETPTQTFIPLHDHIGNIVTLLDTSGNIVKAYRYTAFGIETTQEDTDLNPWRFASKHYDCETGLIYFGRRYYDPSTARWTSPDPEDYNDGPNLYAYVHNSPLTHYDAYGLYTGNWNLPNFLGMMPFSFGSVLPPPLIPRMEIEKAAVKVKQVYDNPRVQGGVQMFGGVCEAAAGAGLTYCSRGTLGSLGWPIMAHGLDHAITGGRNLIFGTQTNSATSTLLQKSGMSLHVSHLTDSALSLGGTLTGIYGTAKYLKSLHASQMPKNNTMNPHEIRFSQDSIKNRFQNGGGCIHELSEGLKNGKINPLSIPPIKIIIRNDVFYSLDNRRLFAFQQANVKIPYIIVQEIDISKRTLFRRFSTENNGISTIVRGQKQNP